MMPISDMSPDEFKRLYMSNFEIDSKLNKQLYDQVYAYVEATTGRSNDYKFSYTENRKLKKWCKLHGISSSELSAMKQFVRQKINQIRGKSHEHRHI